MGDGLYGGTYTPWAMGRTEGVGGFLPMDHGLYGVHLPHASWVVQQYVCPLDDGLYSGTTTPWVIGCTVVHIPHG